MSSNIRIERFCQNCGKQFIAKTTVTKYCGDVCSKRAYKARKRAEKIGESNKETAEQLERKIKIINAKDYITVSEACMLLSVSRWTIWRAIKSNQIKAGKLGRRTLINRKELNKLISNQKQ